MTTWPDLACYSQFTHHHHYHFLMEKSAALLPFLFSLLPRIHPGFPEPSASTTRHSNTGRWTHTSALAPVGGGPSLQVLPRGLCSQESHRTWWLSHRSESLPCTSQSQPACSDLPHLVGCCPVSNPCKTGQKRMVNAPLTPIRFP